MVLHGFGSIWVFHGFLPRELANNYNFEVNRSPQREECLSNLTRIWRARYYPLGEF